ncbi:hypothetical protein [Rothia nasimurium]|uniref:hypothetical protein n=1 Tax=Rothia nasimurium TaxID=85336 RepID=UPI001F15FCC0|nr:hypothetical protein [Rothia nasimurium]
MSENPYTPNTPSSQPDQPEAPASSAGAYAAPGQYPYQDPYASTQQPNGKKPKNVVGLVALGLGILGFILACIPGIMFLGWLFLFAAFVTSIVGLFQKGKEKVSSIVALVLSIVGSIVSTIVLIFVVANTVATDPEFEQAMKDLESAVATPSAVASVSPGVSSSEPAAEDSAAPGSATAIDGVLQFGDTAEFEDGLRLTVSEPRTDYVPSEYASRLDESLTDYVAFTVTIENGTSEPFEPLFYAEGNSGGKAVDQIFDSEQNIGSAPSGRILPGESVTFDVAFGVADPASVTLDVSADFDHDAVLYSNK